MPLNFTLDELAERRRRTIETMTAGGLDGLLLFRQESMYYLTGYASFGYCFFQCLYLGADGRLVLLTRSPDMRVAHYTSMLEDIRVWVDAPDANPSADLRAILEECGCRGGRLGVEWEAHGLTARNGQRLQAALEGFCQLEDASELVSRLRVVKSPAELDHVRRAAALADEALALAVEMARPGVFDGDILAAMQGAVFKGDGDYPANEFIIGSGPAAMFGRYTAGRRRLEADDQLTIEFAGVYRHYHSCLMRTLKIGRPSRRHLKMHEVGLEALAACQEALRPGRPIGEVFAAYAHVIEGAGFGRNRLNACGYSLGATFAPSWMDWPMFYRDNPEPARPGMVFFLHMDVRDDETGLVAIPGETVVVTDSGSERLSQASFEFAVA